MPTLAINTASPEIFIGVFQKGKMIARKTWEGKGDETEKLLAGITTMLTAKKMKFTDIESICACGGPGSFSALRIGVTVANTLAFALNIPLMELGPKDWHTLPSLKKTKKREIIAPKYSLPPSITKPKKP